MAKPEPSRDIVTTFPWPRRPQWTRRAIAVDPEHTPSLLVPLAVARRARRARAVVLDGSTGPRGLYRDLIAAVLVARRRRPPAVVIADCTWKYSSLLDRIACRVGIRLLDGPHVTYCVLSSAEREMFPQTWRVDPERMRVTPWPYTLPDEQVADPPPRDRSVFAGGNSLRDWDTLLEAARGLVVPITLASANLTREQIDGAPSNVTAGPLSPAEFDAALTGAGVVVVPLHGGMRRGAGQTTYVNAMALGKLVIVSEAPGVADQIEDGATGLVVPPGDPRALASAIEWAVDPANAQDVQRICDRAREVALERFSPDAYVNQMLAIVDEAIRAQGQRA